VSAACEKALRGLRNGNPPENTREAIAKRIVELAKKGKRSRNDFAKRLGRRSGCNSSWALSNGKAGHPCGWTILGRFPPMLLLETLLIGAGVVILVTLLCSRESF
jgi:hypothetical protein